VLPRRRANKSQPVALRHFSHWPRRIGSVGRGAPQGVSGTRCGLRHDPGGGGAGKVKSEGKKGGTEWLEKRRGPSASLYLSNNRMADEAGGGR
jgi:hypothetical protein